MAAQDVLALKIHESEGDIGSSNNFISFKDSGGNNIGSIEGNGNGIDLNTMGGDFAEYLPKKGSAEDFSPGAVVGLESGTVSLATEGSERALVVTTSPAVLGNDPGLGEREDHAPVAFLGQVPVRVRGAVEPGDLLVPSGNGDGYAVALSEPPRKPSAFARIIGRALEGSEGPKGKVRATVGLTNTQPLIALLEEQRKEIQEQRQEIRRQHRQLQLQLEGMGSVRERLTALEDGQPEPDEK